MTPQFPSVKLTNPGPKGQYTKVEIDGKDISSWCTRAEVVHSHKDFNTVRLELLVGSLEVDTTAISTLVVDDAVQDLLVKHGWIRPSWTAPAGE